MAYTLKGRLVAYTCDDCDLFLEGTIVRLYDAKLDETLVHRAAADPNQTLHLLDDDAVTAKAGALLATSTVGADGTFTVALPEGYGGGALDIDLYCGTVAGHVPPRPRQVAVTTFQPQWRQQEQGAIAAFSYEIPSRSWCYVLGHLGLWSICGTVTVCGTDTPVIGATVKAFDRDWLQDDALGSAMTDTTGHYRIWYAPADFEKTIFSWLNVELWPGPDVYMSVTSFGGTALLTEAPSMGRSPGRQNVGPCLCLDLCVKSQPPITEVVPVFRFIGGLDIQVDIDSGAAGSGLTLADQRAFYSDLRLNGPIGTTRNGQPLEYRFETRALPAGPWTAVLPSQIAATKIGTWERLVGMSIDVKSVVVNGSPAPNVIVVVPDAQGWIAMPQDNNLLTGLFTPNLDMIRLATTTMAAWGTVDVGGVSAGNSTSGAGFALDRLFGIRLRVREAGNALTEIAAGECETLAIDNTLYDHVNNGGSWAPSQVSGQLAVASLDVLELVTHGCIGIADQLHVLFTAAHPNLGAVSITLTGPGGPYGFTLPAPVVGEQFGTATNGFVVTTLPKCAYIVTLSVDALLTTGDSTPNAVHDQVAFCKG